LIVIDEAWIRAPQDKQHEHRSRLMIVSLAPLLKNRSPQSNNELFHYGACRGSPCPFSSLRLIAADVPLGQVKHDPESFCYIQLRSAGLMYLCLGNDSMGRNLFHPTKPANYGTDAFAAALESVFALCCALYGQVQVPALQLNPMQPVSWISQHH